MSPDYNRWCSIVCLFFLLVQDLALVGCVRNLYIQYGGGQPVELLFSRDLESSRDADVKNCVPV